MVIGIITLLLFGLIGGLAVRAVKAQHAAKPVAVAATARAVSAVAAADVMVDVPLAGEIVGRVFFDVDKSELQADAVAALAPAARALADAPGKELVIAGFHDATGEPAHNAELARQRARSVQAALAAQGADAARLQLRKPEQMALGGPAEEARRVEVRLVD